MAVSDNIAAPAWVLFIAIYISVFILSTVGNTCVLLTCYKTLKRRHSLFMWLLVNLATADLLFTLLSVFNMIGYLWCWVGGNNTCKLQGFFVEASHTTSIMTLVTISYQRLKATTDPFSTKEGHGFNREYLKPVIIWGWSLLVCTPLLQIYGVKTVDGNVACITTRDGFTVPQIYYSLHTALLFAVPLFYMIFTQIRIHLALRTSVTPTSELFTSRAQRRHKKGYKDTCCTNYSICNLLVPFYGQSDANRHACENFHFVRSKPSFFRVVHT